MFEKRLKRLRKEKELTQKELGKRLNLNGSTISFYETGRRIPDYKTLIALADHFQVSTDYLVGRTDIRNNETLKVLNQLPYNLLDKINNDPIKFAEFCLEVSKAIENNFKYEDLTDLLKVVNRVIESS